jgi:hypothetical protein
MSDRDHDIEKMMETLIEGIGKAVGQQMTSLTRRVIQLEMLEQLHKYLIIDLANLAGISEEKFGQMMEENVKFIDHPEAQMIMVTEKGTKAQVEEILKKMMQEDDQ